MTELRCLDAGGRTACAGPVEVRTLPDNPRSFPRCEAHFEARLEQSAHNLELMSSSPAPWFDEAYAGESWDEP